MSDVRDNAALEAALARSGARIKTAGSHPVSDVAGSFLLRGSFEVNIDSTESVRIEVTDGTGGTGYVRFDIEHDGTTTLSSLTATASGTGVSVTADEFWESGSGALINFALDLTVPAPGGGGDGTWSLSVDPYITAGAVGEGVVFRSLSIDRKV